MLGAARHGDRTPTQDVVNVVRNATVLIEYRKASVVGDPVSGPVIVGAVTGGSRSVMIDYLPAARLTSEVVGTHVQTCAPLTTMLAFTSTTVRIGD